MSQKVEKSRERESYVVIYNQGEREVSFLARAFYINSAKDGTRVNIAPEVYGGQEAYIDAAAGEAMEPRDRGMTPGEKILMRFEAAMDGRSQRVDLRFCTGVERLRNPLFDNLRPDYGR